MQKTRNELSFQAMRNLIQERVGQVLTSPLMAPLNTTKSQMAEQKVLKTAELIIEWNIKHVGF